MVLVTEERQKFLDLYEKTVLYSDIHPLVYQCYLTRRYLTIYCRFNATLGELDWVSNYEKTRWFLVLRVSRPENDGLNRLLRISNQCLASFGQPPLYGSATKDSSMSSWKERSGASRSKRNDYYQAGVEDPSMEYSNCFHISIGWNLDEPSAQDRERIRAIRLERAKELEVHFRSVKAKIGNIVSNIDLQTTSLEERGFVGL